MRTLINCTCCAYGHLAQVDRIKILINFLHGRILMQDAIYGISQLGWIMFRYIAKLFTIIREYRILFLEAKNTYGMV